MDMDQIESTASTLQFSNLPTEVKLKIFGYLGYLTLRRVCPFVCKEFNILASDFSLFERYISVDYDKEYNIKASTELRDALYTNNLKELTLTSWSFIKLFDVEFRALEKLTITDVHGITGFNTKPSKLKCVELRGVVEPVIHISFIPCLTSVDTFLMKSYQSLEYLTEVPAKRFLLEIGNDEDSWNTVGVDRISLDTVNDKLDNKEIKQIVASKHSKLEIKLNHGVSEILQPEFTNLLKSYLVVVSWKLASINDWQIITEICKASLSLEELKLLEIRRDVGAPVIENLTTTRLQKVDLQCHSSANGDDILQCCLPLIYNAQDSLCLDNFPLGPCLLRTVRLTTLSLKNCNFPSCWLLEFPDNVQMLEMRKCTFTSRMEYFVQRKRLKSFLIEDYSFETISQSLQLLEVNELKLKILHDEEVDEVDDDSVLRELLTSVDFSHSRVLDLSDEHDQRNANSLLEIMLTSIPHVRVLSFCFFHEVTEETFTLLKRLIHLQRISMDCVFEGWFDKDLVRRCLPEAIIHISDEIKYQHEPYIDTMVIYL